MKKLHDEQIQHLARFGHDLELSSLSVGEMAEINAYRRLFQKLEQPLDNRLPCSFAATVAAILRGRINRKEDIRFYIGSLLVLIFGLCTATGLLYLFNIQAGQLVLEIMNKFKWMILLASVIFLVIQFADQKTVKNYWR